MPKEVTSWQAIIEQLSIAGAPLEVCGLISSDGKVWAMKNVSPNPEIEFAMDVNEVIAVHRRVETAPRARDYSAKAQRDRVQTGDRIVAVWHSHPAGREGLSGRDRRYLVPNLVNIVVAVGGTTRCFNGEGEEGSFDLTRGFERFAIDLPPRRLGPAKSD